MTGADAKKLGEYPVEPGFFDGRKITVRLDESGSTYQFRTVVVPETQNDEATMILMKTFAGEIPGKVSTTRRPNFISAATGHSFFNLPEH